MKKNVITKFVKRTFSNYEDLQAILLSDKMRMDAIVKYKITNDEQIKELLDTDKFVKILNTNDENYDVYIDARGLDFEKPLNLMAYSVLSRSFYGNVLLLKRNVQKER